MSEHKNDGRFEVKDEQDPDIQQTEYMWVWIISIAGAIAIYLQLGELLETFWLQVTLTVVGFVVLMVISAMLRRYIAILGAIFILLAVGAAFWEGIKSAASG